MANKGHGWLYIAEENGEIGELVNHARTSAYLQSSPTLGCGTVYGVLNDGGCPGYRWTPNTGGTWTQKTFTTPAADLAPWYNSKYPESAQALGFWITEWTGLDSGHVKRTSTPIGAYRGGSALGNSSASGRVMGIEMLMIAESEKAIEYLFAWFDSTISAVCATCAVDTLLVRRYCPTVTGAPTATDGVVEIRGAGLVTGMVYGEDPIEQAGCFLRRVNFTIEAQDPCMYALCTSEAIDKPMDWTACWGAVPGNPARATCRPTCSEMPDTCRTVYNYTIDTPSASAPVLTLTVPAPVVNTGGTQQRTIPLRIRTYMNPYGYSAGEICGLPLLAECYVANLPAYSGLKYDMAGRRVQYRDSTSGDWVNGFAFVEPNEPGVSRFPTLGCGSFTTIIEPSNFCVTQTALTPEAGTWLTNAPVRAFASASSAVTANTIIGGDFSTFGPQTQNAIGALNTSGRTVTYNTAIGAGGTITSIAVQTDNKVVIAGTFTTLGAAATTVNRVARLLTTGLIDTTWDVTGTPGVDATVNEVVLQTDNKAVIVGAFTTVRGVAKIGIARFLTTGALDTTYNTANAAFTVAGSTYSLTRQSDGKMVVVGDFVNSHATAKNGITRLNTDGTADTTFNIGTSPGVAGGLARIYVAAIQADGKIIIGGDFTSARGVAKNNLARLNSDGTLDTTFNTGGTVGTVGAVYDILVLPDDTIMIGGAMSTVRGTAIKGVVRLTPVGAIHPAWVTGSSGTNAGGIVYRMWRSAGNVIVGGNFTSMGTATKANVARIYTDGIVDPSYPTTKTYYPGQMLPTPDMQLQERMGCV